MGREMMGKLGDVGARCSGSAVRLAGRLLRGAGMLPGAG